MRCVAAAGLESSSPLRGLLPSLQSESWPLVVAARGLLVRSRSGLQVASLSESSMLGSSSTVAGRSAAGDSEPGGRCCRSERAAFRPVPEEEARLLEPAEPGFGLSGCLRSAPPPPASGAWRKASAVAASWRRPPALASGPSAPPWRGLKDSAEAARPRRPGIRGSVPSEAEGRRSPPGGLRVSADAAAPRAPPFRPGVLCGEPDARGGS
mmetsp:Transcript_67900/g.198683  ORF Transcript_67900/g.198683 Transcript_67900/m.198683 type:complete len:210 (-) Transcript_67900:692-1321(-)